MKTNKIVNLLALGVSAALSCAAQDTTATTKAADSAPAPAAPAVEVAAAPVAAPGDTAAPAAPAPSNVIPLIQFVDAPLTAVIENLARQAGINYILDPKINYGQAGPDGKVNPQPSISIRWENLTAQQALEALLVNYDLQITEDSKTKIARISPKDPAAPDPLATRVIQLKFANPSLIVVSVQSALTDKRSKVMADVRTSQLVVVATDREIAAVEELVGRLDTMTKQVLIEARLIETSLNPRTAKGIDWSGTLQNQHFTFGNGTTVGTVSSTTGTTAGSQVGGVVGTPATPFAGTPGAPAGSGSSSGSSIAQALTTTIGGGGLSWNTLKGLDPATAFLNADGMSAVLSFLNSDSDAKVLSTPRAVTLDNETAHLEVTVARPIFKVTAGTANTTGGSEVTYTNLGTILDVTPRISANNYVNLKVIPEVSSFVDTVTKTVLGTVNQADEFAFRKIQTQVLIPSGNTLVLGGLVSDASTKGYTKVPVLGDIPFLGLAFRHDTKERNQANLTIFITPTIIQDSDFQPTTTDYLKTKPLVMSEKPWSAWDSGKPALDWSRPSGGVKEEN